MLRYKVHILGLSEVRRNGFGELRTHSGLTILYSGKEDDLISDVAKKSLLDW